MRPLCIVQLLEALLDLLIECLQAFAEIRSDRKGHLALPHWSILSKPKLRDALIVFDRGYGRVAAR